MGPPPHSGGATPPQPHGEPPNPTSRPNPWERFRCWPLAGQIASWVVAALVVITVIATAVSGSQKPQGLTATQSPVPLTTVPVTTAVSSTVPATTSTTPGAPVMAPSEASGTDVINSAGVILPNPQRTPGAVNPQVTQADIDSTICVSGWTSTVRPPSSYTTSLKEQQLATGYAYQGDTNPSDYEEDHLIPLELGGSPASVSNLWPQPYNVTDGARIKDQVENKLHSLVCDGALSLTSAQQKIASNWFVAYETYVGGFSGTVTPPSTTATTSPPVQRSSLTCTASMSKSAPSDYSTDYVIVQTAGGASVSATAHYKTTDTTRTGTADSSGKDSLAFQISGATKVYTVQVDVTVSSGGASGSCSTSFTPQ